MQEKSNENAFFFFRIDRRSIRKKKKHINWMKYYVEYIEIERVFNYEFEII